MKTKNKLTKALKKEWLDALKSGDYVQGTEQLRKKEDGVVKHCCLAVFCEVHPNMSISNTVGADMALVNNRNSYRATRKYEIFNQFTGFRIWSKIASANDNECDGKYTAVIPLIEELQTVD